MTNQLRQAKPDKMLQAYIEQRKMLWTQVIKEKLSYTKEKLSYTEVEIVARLEQFGAWLSSAVAPTRRGFAAAVHPRITSITKSKSCVNTQVGNHK
jgi:hypothetical protein